MKLCVKQRIWNSLLSVLCCFLFAACNQDVIPDDDASLRTSVNIGTVCMQDFTPVGNEAVGTEVVLTDRRDGIVYRCIKMADGRWWMGENLKFDIEGSVFYDNDSINLATYGRLYNWQGAQGAAPENWSLASDDEWKALEMALGMTQADADADAAWRNSGNVGTQLKLGGSSGMNLLLGGSEYNGGYYNLGTWGEYWIYREYDTLYAWSRYVDSSQEGVYRTWDYKTSRFPVRCILQVKETTQYMQDFTPAGNEAVGTEVMLTDKRDNIVYRCIKMADGRWWMGENLRGRFGTFVEGQPTETYGLLYDWATNKDYVPEGWSLPANAEWNVLREVLGGLLVAGKEMKSTTGWNDFNGVDGNGTNSSGFNGLPAGYHNVCRGGYYHKGQYAYWWSAESYEVWNLIYNHPNLAGPHTYGDCTRFPVRCVKSL